MDDTWKLILLFFVTILACLALINVANQNPSSKLETRIHQLEQDQHTLKSRMDIINAKLDHIFNQQIKVSND